MVQVFFRLSGWENLYYANKNKIIHTRHWKHLMAVEIATFEWVNWWNNERLHEPLNYRPPREV